MVINAKPDYDATPSWPTSRPSARPRHAPASRRFKSAVLKLPHLNQVQQYADNNNNNKVKNYNDNDNKDKEKDVEVDLLAQALKDAGVAFHETSSGEKHHQNQKNRKHMKCQNEKRKEKGYQYQYQYQHQYGPYGSQTQHGQQAQAPPSASKSTRHDAPSAAATDSRGHDSTNTTDENDDTPVTIQPHPNAPQRRKRKNGCKKVRQLCSYSRQITNFVAAWHGSPAG